MYNPFEFKIGDKIICVNNSYSRVGKDTIINTDLSMWGVYVVMDIKGSLNEVVWVINNKGILDYFYKDRFVKLSLYRNNKIDEILK